MEDDTLPTSCNLLKEPLSLSDLINTGTNFEINANFDEGITDDIYDELNLGSDNEDDEGLALDSEALVSPWTKPFSELKQHMVKIDDYIYKKVMKEGDTAGGLVPLNARVCLRYNGYWEGEGAPFDSCVLRGSTYKFYTGRNEVLEGLEAAVRTMCRGEESQFVISYHLLFKEMGCPPRVKPQADALFIISLKDFNAVGDVDADQQLPEEDRNKYTLVIDKVKEIHLKGLDFFGQRLYKNACRAFEKAVSLLTYCRLANEEEEREQTAFLLKLHTNLAVCYLKVNAPAKTCIMCKEIRRLTNNKPSCKALFQEGRALLLLGDYKYSREVLLRALRMEPHNVDINNELKKLDERFAQYKENEKNIWTKALGIIKPEEKDTKTIEKEQTEFEVNMLDLLQSFKDSLNQKKLKLPSGLTKSEIDIVDQLAERLELKLSLCPLDNATYTLHRK